jgi:ribonucleotide reductase beta subunit family protein with ferritin-like domain
MACVELIFFSASFSAIFYFGLRGLMPGLTFANKLISRDESMHGTFAALMYEIMERPLSNETVQAIVRDAVDCEKEFVAEALRAKLIGMNEDLLSQYVEYVADRTLKQFKVPPIYNVANSLPWMERISLDPKDSFFEKRVSNYRKAGVGLSAAANSVSFDADF